MGRAAIPSKRRRRHPLRFLRTAVAHRRSAVTDTILGTILAFVAGAMNAGGFLAIGQYTSHMTGIVSSIADDLALGLVRLAFIGVLAVVAFAAGAGSSAILINWGRRNTRNRQYAYPLALESVLLMGFGALGTVGHDLPQFLTVAPPLLCYIMGLQNATITKISGARVRTTHLTGMVTDIGIELGKALYFNRASRGAPHVTADWNKLSILARVVTAFFTGGIIGALGFGRLGFGFSLVPAIIVGILAAPQLIGHLTGRSKTRDPSPPAAPTLGEV